MPTNTMTIDKILLKLGLKEFWNGFETTDEDTAKDYCPDITEAKQSLNTLILAEFTELINSQKPTYIFSATNGKEDTAINKAALLAVAQRKYGEPKL